MEQQVNGKKRSSPDPQADVSNNKNNKNNNNSTKNVKPPPIGEKRMRIVPPDKAEKYFLQIKTTYCKLSESFPTGNELALVDDQEITEQSWFGFYFFF